jgi:anti-sigma regulatory factor (Ser/Thr protein kinase)
VVALLSVIRERLIERWLGGAAPLDITDEASVATARTAARDAGAAAGLDATARERLAVVVSELGHNQRKHAAGGAVALRQVTRHGVVGVEIIAADRGEGILDPTRALAGDPSAGITAAGKGGLGIGLSSVLRQADEVDADVRWGEGTCIRARVFAAPVPRSEVAILGRAGPDDPVSGDDATFVRGDAGVLVAVADGLGHGPAARDAALKAIAVVHGAAHLPLAEIFMRCEGDLTGSRGAVMAVAHVDLARRELTHAALGNITSRIHAVDGTPRPMVSTAGTLGVTRPPRRLASDVIAFAPPQVLSMVSDGIVSRVDLTGQGPLLRMHPLAIAHHVMTKFARGRDDAMILVLR